MVYKRGSIQRQKNIKMIKKLLRAFRKENSRCKTEVLTYKSNGKSVKIIVGEGWELLSKMKCVSKK